MVNLFTIGFSGKSARIFFELLKKHNIKLLIDIRLNNVSQLSGYTKKEDLIYFLDKICGIAYNHAQFFAPTKEILDSYKKKEIVWNEYERRYLTLLNDRELDSKIASLDLHNACLLCSEAKPDFCHRRLAANYIKSKMSDAIITHI